MNSVGNELLSGIVYASSAQKGISSVSVYFSKMKELWSEFDALMPCPDCGCEESKRYAEHFGNHRLLQFLMGLDETYSQSSNQIMMKNFKPKRKTGPNNVSQYTRAQTSIGSSNVGFEEAANCAGHSQHSSLTSTNNGCEFFNSHMSELLQSLGIIHQSSCVYTPQQNGVAERRNRHILNVARALRFQAGVPLSVTLPNDIFISPLPPSSISLFSPTSSLISASPTHHNLDQLTQAAAEVEPESLAESTHDQSPHQTSTTNNHLVETSSPRRSGRTTYVSYKNVSDSYAKALSSYSAVVEPQSYAEAIKEPKWIAAMKAKISALEDNHTWSIVEVPAGKVPIGCKWVFKVKYTTSSEVERYKARLVVKGYSQKEGLDYTENLSPVAKMVTARSVIAIAATKHWPLFQIDVHNALLHGELLEEVYMDVPKGFAIQAGSHKVCKLHRSLYGLKHTPGQWNMKLTNALVQLGFTQSHFDYSLFIKNV
ncbi:uncharacterized protein LOC142166923 [Nicotiana tabacum]|uniref:Uncharacterized protein LOC142166923 n=1 Tax=Nicotiana tabacum TaxID=4097 RepID=A0AC58SD38_TOBAC